MALCSSRSPSPGNSPRWSKRLCGALLCGLLALCSSAQGRKELERRRDALDKQIKETGDLIEQAKSRQQTTQAQLQLLDARIRQRQELISTVNSEIFRVDQEMQDTREAMNTAAEDLQRLKEEYARMVQFAYENRSAYDRLSYIFAAESFAQAFRRSHYLEQLAEQRRQQAARIAEMSDTLADRAAQLAASKKDKTELLGRQVAEAGKLAVDKREQQSTLQDLKTKEGQLRDSLRKQQKKRSELAAAIRKAINAEIAKSTKAKAHATTTSSASKSSFTLTPEAKVLNADFEKNKGRLPWPVDKGTITSNFGKQPHPVLKGITIENNGLDIGCAPGSAVRAIFRGEVSSVIVLPGAGKAVIVSHGAYRTVYSNLRDVTVNKGDKVETKQPVGVVMTEDGTSTAHIEVWKIGSDGQLSKVDPAAWLYH